MVLSSGLPAPLQSRLAALPAGLRDHIERVRSIAHSLAATHGADAVVADLTAADDDVARHLPGAQLIEEAERLGLPVSDLERRHPILLHGPVGAAWLRNDGAIDDPEVLEGVYWHTTAHPALAPVGRVSSSQTSSTPRRREPTLIRKRCASAHSPASKKACSPFSRERCANT